jgi:3-methylfumaryl-CoA hydratase
MTLDAMSFEQLASWRGRRDRATDWIAAAPAAALAATLDREEPPPIFGAALPPSFHWLYFLPVVPRSLVGEDGHPQRGGFLPPVPLPRRMWAAGRLLFPGALRVGEAASRESEIVDVRMKEGRSGPLVFVTLRHTCRDAGGAAAIVEEQDIVYRDHPTAGSAPAAVGAPSEAAWSREVRADALLLFRYSALTFNGHRIHYDRPYATGVEGYPGLVVHGPLLATLLLDLVRSEWPEASIAEFEFRAIRPLFDGAAFHICGDPVGDGRHIRLWVQDATGSLCMDAVATLS